MVTTIQEMQPELDRDLPAPTVAKTMAVIEAVGTEVGELTQAEVVQQTGCSAKLVFRVLSTLATVNLKSFTENTKATRAALLDDLPRIRQRGYAEDWGEGIEGIRCVAAPILDVWQRPVGALTVMSPSKRMPHKRFPEVGDWCIHPAERVHKELLS